MATIPGVSDGDLIRTTWGDAVANELNGNVVKRAGSTMTGGLVIDATPDSAGTLSTTGRITCGGDMVSLTATQSSNATAATRRDWVQNLVDTQINGRVAVAGDSMTGGLLITSDDPALRLRAPANNPLADFQTTTGIRQGYLQGTNSTMTLYSAADITLNAAGSDIVMSAGGSERLRLKAGEVLVGKTASDANVVGAEISGGGSSNEGRFMSTTSATGKSNVYCRHMSGADADDQVFALFTRSSAGTNIGSITQFGTSSVRFNEPSDYRLKDELGPIEDATERLMGLQPKRLRWKSDQIEFEGFIAHEVDAVVPYAVTGAKDAVLPQDDEFNPGGIDPQQLDSGQLIPLLTAALQDAHARIVELSARLDTLEAT